MCDQLWQIIRYEAGDPVGANGQHCYGVVEASQFVDFMKVLDKLAIALKGDAEALDRQHQIKFTNALEARRQHLYRRNKNGPTADGNRPLGRLTELGAE
ncbi:hypothetical protein [Tardiphaga robiniae]|uniref:Uncharacterized protein n=1 Tax=Tardiphaga robiniae TaxID=943830 RepID=A0A161SM37_9BRAD|nr:hypothetical protein [Tardiphaga robiniae]KZD21352.1 hypothetical protein A4A58_13285 [Tardiphaga robiniae]